MHYIAPQDLSLLEALLILSPQSSKNTLRSWIKEGRVSIDHISVVHLASLVRKGQRVEVGARKKKLRADLPILYEDRDLVVIDKPAGLLSVAAAFERENTVQALLNAHYSPRRVGVVHRLDQDTSGIMVFALNDEACARLKELFAAHEMGRSYVAVVEGRFPLSEGTWHSYQYEDAQYVVHETDDPSKGRLAITHFRVLAHSARYSLLQLQLKTGRKNQIRVHCQAAGYPIAGDKKYGGHATPFKRLCLHARSLVFQHPFSKKSLSFDSPPPPEFYALVGVPPPK